jgi:diguanylate cyclase
VNAIALSYLLLAAQMGLYGVLWSLTAWLVRSERLTGLLGAAYSLCWAGALALFALRGTLTPWLTYTGADVLVLCGFTLLWGRAYCFDRGRFPWRRWSLVTLLGALLLIWAGPAPEHMGLRLLLLALFSGVSGFLMICYSARPLRQQLGTPLSWLICLLGLAAILAWGERIMMAQSLPIPAQDFVYPSSHNILALLVIWLLTIALQLGQLFMVVLRNTRKLNDLSVRDALTQLLNRRGFEARWRELPAASRSLLLIDVDHFKQVNDRHGHDVGDRVLCHLARQFTDHMGPSATLARIGGEEFAILLPGEDIANAHGRAEYLRSQIAATPLPSEQGTLHVTVSIGVATSQGECLFELLKQADLALYLAKRRGRNCVASQQDLAAQMS